MAIFSIKDFFTSSRAKMVSFVINTDENIPAKTLVDSAGTEVLGSPTDAKNAATDATPVKAIPIWKQISASVQSIASSVAGTITVSAHAVTNAGTFLVQAVQSGTWNVNQAGTWTVQPGNTANTTAWKVDGSAVTQPVSGAFFQATQPVSGTFWQATQPVSGTVTVTGDVGITSLIPGTAASSLGKAIDSVAGATDTGAAVLAVRDDALTTLTPVDGDYVPLRVNSTGALHVTGGGGGTEYTEDVAAAADPSGQMLMGVRRDTLSASEVTTDGDNIAIKATNKGQLHILAEITPSQLPEVRTVAKVMADGYTLVGLATDQPAISVSGTFWQATQPVSGTVTVTNAGTFAVQAASTLAAETTKVIGTVNIAAAQSVRTISGATEYEVVAASDTDEPLGATGAVGDYLDTLICVVSTAATSQVQIKDGDGSAITVLPNNVGGGVGTYHVVIGLPCVNATTPGWKVTTAAGVSVLATGNFT